MCFMSRHLAMNSGTSTISQRTTSPFLKVLCKTNEFTSFMMLHSSMCSLNLPLVRVVVVLLCSVGSLFMASSLSIRLRVGRRG